MEQIVGHEYPRESPVLHAVSPNHEQELFLAVYAHEPIDLHACPGPHVL